MSEQNPAAIRLEALKSQANTTTVKDNIFTILEGLGNLEFGTAFKGMLNAATDNLSNHATKEHRAFALVHNALSRAMVNLLNENSGRQDMLRELKLSDFKPSAFQADLVRLLENETVDRQLFSDPKSLPLVAAVQGKFRGWLNTRAGLSDEQARIIAALLPAWFFKELFEEMSDRMAWYEPVRQHFENPLFDAWERQARREAYFNQLKGKFALPVPLTPAILLSELYVEPDFRLFKGCKTGKDGSHFHGEKDAFDLVKYEGGIHAFMHDWLNGKPTLDAPAEKERLLLLLGQPGQGKTSFCKKTIVQALETEPLPVQAVWFQRLVEFKTGEVEDLVRKPLEAIAKKLAAALDGNREPLPDSDFENSLLLLDGFDELYMAQGLSNSEAGTFLTNLGKESRQRRGLHIVLTSRHNYVSLNEIRHHDCLVLALENLSLAQQQTWLERYKSRSKDPCRLNAAKLQTIAEGKGSDWEELQNLVNQPILLHMMAAIDCEITAKENRAKIYKTLFDRLINRKWEKEKLEKHKRLHPGDFRHFLQDLALFIFQSKTGYASYPDFEDKDKPLRRTAEDLLERMDMKNQPLDDALKYLLIAFYFTEKPKTEMRPGERDEFAVEFLHKSFMEYLVAEKIWRFFKEDLGDDRVRYWEEALEKMFPVLSPKILSAEVVWYLKDMIENDEEYGIENKRKLRGKLKDWLPDLLERDFLLRYDAKRDAMPPMDMAVACFYGFWTVASLLVEKVNLPKMNLNDSIKKKRAVFKASIEDKNLIPTDSFRFFEFLVITHRFSYSYTLQWFFFHQTVEYGMFVRGVFENSEFYGTYINVPRFFHSFLQEIKFENCFIENGNFPLAAMIRVNFINCIISKVDFASGETIMCTCVSSAIFNSKFCNRFLKGMKFINTTIKNCKNGNCLGGGNPKLKRYCR